MKTFDFKIMNRHLPMWEKYNLRVRLPNQFMHPRNWISKGIIRMLFENEIVANL